LNVLLAAKKEEVEAIEKEAKDKHEKEWEGERRVNLQKHRAISIGL